MSKEKYEAAVKKLKAEKPKSNYLVISIHGGDKIILPHAEGIAVLAALNVAEKFDGKWSPDRILQLSQGDISTESLSAEDYERFKLAALLNITMQDIRQMEESLKETSNASS